MKNILINLFISEKMWLIFWAAISLILFLILDNIRLRYIRKIKNRIIDNQCTDLNNALNGRKDLVFNRMNKDINKKGLSCAACKYDNSNKKIDPCYTCNGTFSNFKFGTFKNETY